MKTESYTCDLCKNPIEPFGRGYHGSGIWYRKNGRGMVLCLCSASECTVHICDACKNQIYEAEKEKRNLPDGN